MRRFLMRLLRRLRKTNRVVTVLLYAVFGLLTFFVSLTLSLPLDKIKDRLERELSQESGPPQTASGSFGIGSGMDVSIGELDVHILQPGFSATDVRLKPRKPLAGPTTGDTPAAKNLRPIVVDRIDARIHPLDAAWGTKSGRLLVEAFGGELQSEFSVGDDGVSVDADLHDVMLIRLSSLAQLLPLPMLGATNNDAGESGLTPFTADLRSEDELRHVPASNGGEVAFLPLDDARLSRSLDEVIARRVAFLTAYQNAKYAKRYSDFVAKVRAVESAKAPGSTDLSEAVARYFFKLMAYKDEYEVARLYTSGDFKRRLEQQFEGDYKLKFHLAPPLFARKNAQGQLQKKEYGSWMLGAFGVLAKLRGLRGTPLDVFGYTAERRGERALIGEYEKTIALLLNKLDGGNVDLAADIASIPEHIRGYGHVKEAHLHKAKAREAELLKEWDNPLRVVQAA